MNFIKTSKFSVKGIDTTRYISTSDFCEEESPPFYVLGGVGGGLCPPPFIVMPSKARHLLLNRRGQKSPFRTYPIKDL